MAGRSPVRYMAPLALIIFVVAMLVVVAGSGAGGSKSAAKAGTTTRAKAARSAKRARPRTVYIVRQGDLLSTIASKTGVALTRLQQLNPDVDPQTLVPGQRLKLRE
jgi:LysM repeat protein